MSYNMRSNQNLMKASLIAMVAALLLIVTSLLVVKSILLIKSAPDTLVAEHFTGSIYSPISQEEGSMSLVIDQSQGQGHIEGILTLDASFLGSGRFTGTMSAKGIQFTVFPTIHLKPIVFIGTVHTDGSLSGAYCDMFQYNQCNPKSLARGTWNVSKS